MGFRTAETKDRMTRIGFAYNQKPEQGLVPPAADAESPRADDEPPSTRRDASSRTSRSPAAAGAASASPLPTSDEYAEWDSPETIAAVEGALAELGEVIRLEATPSFPEQLRTERPDIVFNMAEGLAGPNREAHVPAICEFFGVPYSGSDPFTLSLCLDKGRTKEVLAYHGVPTAAFAVVSDVDELPALVRRIAPHGRRSPRATLPWQAPLALPLFAKPVHEGSSKGITERNYCRTARELEETVAFLLDTYAQPVLVEEFLPGAEFTCAVLGNGDGATVLPIIAMEFGSLPEGALPIYGFEAKWLWDRPEQPLHIFDCPARIDDALRARIEEVTLHAYRVLGCRDWSRVDVRLDAAGTPNVVEVNPLPGILPDPADNSCFPKAARAAGMSYDELVQACLRLAAVRQGVPLPGTGAMLAAPRRRTAALG